MFSCMKINIITNNNMRGKWENRIIRILEEANIMLTNMLSNINGTIDFTVFRTIQD